MDIIDQESYKAGMAAGYEEGRAYGYELGYHACRLKLNKKKVMSLDEKMSRMKIYGDKLVGGVVLFGVFISHYAFDADFSSVFLPALMGVYLLNRSY